MAKLIMASLVDPASHPGGAGTYTRGLLAALGSGHVVRWSRRFTRLLGPGIGRAKWCRWPGRALSELPAKVLFARQHEFKTENPRNRAIASL